MGTNEANGESGMGKGALGPLSLLFLGKMDLN